jgi:hypothetical protein
VSCFRYLSISPIFISSFLDFILTSENKMLPFRLFGSIAVVSISTVWTSIAQAQYTGYQLKQTGDQDFITYETDSTKIGAADVASSKPDVHLNASVGVGEILLQVDDIDAKINIDAQVLQLLQFNAGVDVHIDRVRLQILNVKAKVLLEARLGNLLLMVKEVLDSIDLNPVLGALGNGLNNVVNTTAATLSGKGPKSNGAGKQASNGGPKMQKRSDGADFPLDDVLYSVNDYAGNAHTNRILSQNGDITDQYLDNQGNIHGNKVVGNFETDMEFTGKSVATPQEGDGALEKDYVYNPFPGLSIVARLVFTGEGKVLRTRVLSETVGGAGSTIRA